MRSRSQRSSKAQLVPVGVSQVEEAFAPLGVARRGVGRAAGRDEMGMKRIDIGYVEYQSSPPRPVALGRLDDQVDEIAAGAKTAEPRVLTAIQQLEPQHPVKPNSPLHVVGGERNGADAFDHRGLLTSGNEPAIIERRSPLLASAAHRWKSASTDLPRRALDRRGPARSPCWQSCNPIGLACERAR